MPKIAQIFNNNVALVDLDNHSQAVVKGRGIAFNKKRGDVIPANKIEKIFYLATETSRQNLYFLLRNIPIDVVTTTYEIIDLAQKQFHLKVLDYIYITLSDHIYEAYKRYKAGDYQESLVPDFHIQYPAEYAVAKQALQVIDANLGVQFPLSEVKNLALHFINATGEDDGEQAFGQSNEASLSKLVRDVLSRHGITRSHTSGDYYDRFMIHLQYLIDRLQRVDTDSVAIIPEVATELEQNYPRSYQIASEIFDEIKEKLYRDISEDERLYFIIHIQRLINETPAAEQTHDKK
ncbi:transcription antiterminator lact [Lacticaseibacillus chiayiensis]|uniref:PRD domain-containing protein n=1 Tax=Lacticaseibacillus chiayiensis TaxID=2100821 RepID=A0A4Q1TK33_9LACO|nr:transcription antiterminator LacT [Lacticaseibacillus chiayiensis]QVI35247.1 PRD domain-containing protein [Lacticaseibacillus chiayiensis]RXT18892.1 transcription antiterminator lact [Lacticaseibacillus chiayiensis]RXT58227.1 transcription antiterminator lact [Lacticaseibacillus chiayiensis]UYN57028.1 PRD domain-containing protein [Lacticaseibacillus chiayiensis]